MYWVAVPHSPHTFGVPRIGRSQEVQNSISLLRLNMSITYGAYRSFGWLD